MTDAMARQHIQRWTGQLVAPEYLGAHVSAPRSHQTGRTLSLDFRAATAFFLAFGIEWDLTAGDARRARGARRLVSRCTRSTGRCCTPAGPSGSTRPTPPSTPTASSRRTGTAPLLCHVQLDESTHNRGCTLRLPGLRPDATYRLEWLGPGRPAGHVDEPRPARRRARPAAHRHRSAAGRPRALDAAPAPRDRPADPRHPRRRREVEAVGQRRSVTRSRQGRTTRRSRASAPTAHEADQGLRGRRPRRTLSSSSSSNVFMLPPARVPPDVLAWTVIAATIAKVTPVRLGSTA